MRKHRYQIIKDNCYFHLFWKCHNKQFLIEYDWAKQLLYDLLLKYKDKYCVTIFSYCFLSNHPHITGFMKSAKDFSRFMQVAHSQFARKVNKVLSRCGQLVMDRPKTPMIENETHLLNTLFYIDLNPVKANLVKHPRFYKWSSYNYYAYGKQDPLITAVPIYLSLGKTPLERQERYRKMVFELLRHKGYIVDRRLKEECFIGDPAFVVEHYEKLREYMRKKRKEYEKLKFANDVSS